MVQPTKKFNRQSTGVIGTSVSARLNALWYTKFLTSTVPLPAQIERSFIVFNLKEEFSKDPKLKDKTETDLANLVLLAQMAKGWLSKEEIARVAPDLGVTGDGTDMDEVLDIIHKRIDDSLIKNPGGNLFIKSVIENLIHTMPDKISPTPGNLAQLCSTIHDVHQRVVTMNGPAELTTFWMENALQQPLFAWVSKLDKYVRSPSGSTVQIRKSHVMNEFFQLNYDEPMVAVEEDLAGLVYTQKSTVWRDYSMSDMITAHALILRLHQGESKGIEGQFADITTLLKSKLFQERSLMGYLPEGYLNPDYTAISDLIGKLWYMNVIDRVLTSNYGELESRYQNLIEQREFSREPGLFQLVKDMFRITSVSFAALRDTAAQIKAMIFDPSIVDPALHPAVKKIVSDWYFESLGAFNSFEMPSDHPRATRESALIVNPEGMYINIDPMPSLEFRIEKEDSDRAVMWYTDLQRSVVTQGLSSPLLSRSQLGVYPSSIYGASAPIAPTLPKVSPIFIYDSGIDFYSGLQIYKSLLTTFRLSEFLASKLGVTLLLSDGELRHVTSNEELAEWLKIPTASLRLANKIDNTLFISFKDVKTAKFVFPQKCLKIYEVEQNYLSLPSEIVPHVAEYPALLTTTTNMNFITPPAGSKEPVKIVPPPVMDPIKKDPASKGEE